MEEILKRNMGEDWYDAIDFPMINYEAIFSYLRRRKEADVSIYPYSHLVFNAFRLTPFDKVKVVILGQDPYYTLRRAKPVAHGLAFSYIKRETQGYDKDTYIPPSLRNIFNEINDELGTLPTDTDLTRWAKQGVFLYNTALTVEKEKPASHLHLWKSFTDHVFKALQKKDNLIYLLWGQHAQSFQPKITNETHSVLVSSHPSPLSAHQGFYGCNHFITTNKLLKSTQQEEINWL